MPEAKGWCFGQEDCCNIVRTSQMFVSHVSHVTVENGVGEVTVTVVVF